MAQLHIRYDGRSYDVEQNLLDIGEVSSDEQILSAVTAHLNLESGKLSYMHVERNRATGDITVRPEAVFG